MELSPKLGHTTSLNKYKNVEINSFILSDNNGLKLENNNKRNDRIYSNTQSLKNILFNDQWVFKK
jgi:hypothetical protein